MLHDLISNPDVLTAFGGLIAVLLTFFKGTEMYQSRVNMKERAFIGLAERAVAWQWHNYLRGATDRAAVRVEGLGNAETVAASLETSKQGAHSRAVKQIIDMAAPSGLANHPAIVAAKNGNTAMLDAAVVSAVKRFKAGTAGLHTAPSTKGN